jgi:two-component system nitrate/nitrite response regulator NarL
MLNKLCLVSPNPIARDGLARTLSSEEFEVIAALPNLNDLPLLEEKTTMVVLDISRADLQLASLVELRERHPGISAVVLADRFEHADMMQCFRAGASGYIVKDIDSPSLLCLLRIVAMGQKVVPSHVIDVFENQASYPSQVQVSEKDVETANLSAREQDVLCCVMAGMANKVIARELNLSEATVKVHVKAILRKLEVGNRTQAAIWASTKGISPETALSL